jgi:hypothetical protein
MHLLNTPQLSHVSMLSLLNATVKWSSILAAAGSTVAPTFDAVE